MFGLGSVCRRFAASGVLSQTVTLGLTPQAKGLPPLRGFGPRPKKNPALPPGVRREELLLPQYEEGIIGEIEKIRKFQPIPMIVVLNSPVAKLKVGLGPPYVGPKICAGL